MDLEGVPPAMAGGMRWRISVSILSGVGWLAFVLIWLFFFAAELSIYRNLAILFLSLLLVGAVLAAVWVSFGLGMGMKASPEARERMGMRSMRWRLVATLLLWAAWAALVIVWLYFLADGFSGYQNVAVVIVSLLLAAGISAVIWVRAAWHG